MWLCCNSSHWYHYISLLYQLVRATTAFSTVYQNRVKQTVIKVSKMFVMSDEGLVICHMQDLLHVEGVYLCSFIKAPLRMKFQTNCLSLSFLPDFYLLSFDDQLSSLQVILAAQHSCGPLCSSSLPSLKS